MSEFLPPAEERPSKTQRKRQMHARQALGEKLVALNAQQLAQLKLPEQLHESIQAAWRLSGHEARRRQLQFIGKLMRAADFEAIRSAYENLLGASHASVALMHRCERLRDQLITDTRALDDFVRDHPDVDTQWLRAKVRAARQEREALRPPRHARELYRWLHTVLQAQRAAQGSP
ncbi:MAG TPA: ribosome biogenesis factor YjgA [Burkholderiaceae bacterium]|nr:ribosome biogenesis factor YjgA [Burkholderiaceae bacterium]